MNEILRLDGVDYLYGDKFPALKDVSVTFNKGERVAVLGGNGAGKSTFFLCCNGVLSPQKGNVFLKGTKITGAKRDVLSLRQAVGLVFQEPDSQIIAGTVENEVSFGPMNIDIERDEVLRRVTWALERMKLENYRKYAPHYLSGGERKRVTIADILAMRPELILFDEPTASLDPENVIMFEQILYELNNEGITTVVSTHDVDFAYRFAERAVVFRKGAVLADMEIEKVFASDEIVLKAGLRKPLLYSAAEIIKKRFPGVYGDKGPRRVEDFEAFLSCLENVL